MRKAFRFVVVISVIATIAVVAGIHYMLYPERL